MTKSPAGWPPLPRQAKWVPAKAGRYTGTQNDVLVLYP